MQQNQAKLYVEREFTVAQADKRLFSSFLEHLGRAIYEGIYEPGHPLADEDGFRTDVLKLVREWGFPMYGILGVIFSPDITGGTVLVPRKSDPPGWIWLGTPSRATSLASMSLWIGAKRLEPR